MGNVDPQTTLRGRDDGENEVFRLHFEWTGETRTSLHKHRGWELVLVLAGTVGAVVDGKRTAAGPGGYTSPFPQARHTRSGQRNRPASR
jgi:anti-sigma factor ChrR (cupin superfamily)